MVSEVISIEVREDGSRAVASQIDAIANSSDRAGDSSDALQKIMQSVSTTMDRVANVIDKLNTTMAAQASTTQRATQAATQATGANTAMAASASALAESEADAEARIRATVSASLAQIQASNGVSAAASAQTSATRTQTATTTAATQASAALAASYTATASAAVRQIQQVEALESALSGGVKSMDQWRDLEGRLVAAQQQGVITGTQYTSMIRQLDALLPNLNASLAKEQAALTSLTRTYDPLAAKMAKLQADEKTLQDLRTKGLVNLETYNRLTASIGAQKLVVQGAEEATDKLSKFGETSAGAKREFGVLIGEMARGNFAALEGSAITLTNRLGILEKAFTATGLAVGIFLGVLGFLAVALFTGYEQQTKLNDALIATGQYGRVASGDINNLAASMTAVGKSSAQNIELLTALAATGRTTADTFQAVGRAASDAMKLTGDSVDSVVQSFTPLYTDPLKWADDMDQKWNFLTLATRDHIQKLQDTGDTYGAVKVAGEAFADAMDGRVKTMIDNAGLLEKTWRGVADYLGYVKQFYADIGKEGTTLDKFQEAKNNYLEWQQKVKAANVDIYDPKNNDALANGTRLWNLMKDARDKVVGDQAYTQAADQAESQRKAQLAAGKDIDSINDKTQKQITLQNQLNKLKQDYKLLNTLDPNDARLKGVSFGADGDPSGGGYASKVAELTQKADGKPKTPRQSQATDKDAEALARQEKQFDSLRGSIDPTRAALDQMAKSQELYEVAVKNGWIDQDQANFELAQYQLKLQDTINPLEALTRSLDLQIAGFKNVASVSKAEQETEKARQDLLQKGVVLDDAQTAALRDKYAEIEKGNVAQQLQQKVLKSAMTQTQEQIDQLKILNQLQEAGSLTKDQVSKFEVKQNPDVFAGTGIAQQQQLDQQQQYYDLVNEMRQQDLLSERDAAIAKSNIDRSMNNIRLQGTLTFLGQLATMQSSHNRTQAAIGKAAAIAETSINTYKSATSAFSAMAGIPFVGPILGAIAAAAAIASGLAQIQQIRSVNTTGFMNGGYTGDVATNAVAGQVHGQEFVSNAATTARYRPQLEAMHAGTYNPDAPSGNGGKAPVFNIPPANVKTFVIRNENEMKDYLTGEEGEQIVVMHMGNNAGIIGK